MSSADSIQPDPFRDPSANSSQREFTDEDTTLLVGRNASLTLGTDSLIVLDESFPIKNSRCCGLIPGENKTTQAIPFFNILWAELQDLEVVIHYARQITKNSVRVNVLQYLMDKVNSTYVQGWIAKLLDRAYGQAQRQKRIKVLINPFGGQGKAQKWYSRDIEPILAAARCTMDVERTQFKGHAIEIAENLDIEAYDVVASCSGDGLPHEVFNGLGKRADARRALSKLAVTQLPCGTGNAMSLSLYGTNQNSISAVHLVKGIRTPMDLVSVTQGESRTLSFLSQSVGIIADVDLGTENLRWLGEARFTIGYFQRLLGKTIYPADIAMDIETDSKDEIREHFQSESESRKSIEDRRREFEPALPPNGDDGPGLPELRYGTVRDPLPEGWEFKPYDNLGNFWCGNMPMMADKMRFFPAALPHDGFADLVTIAGDIPRKEAVRLLLAVDKQTIFDQPLVRYRKVRGYRIVPKNQKTGYISIDGESVPFEPYQAEVHHGLGTVLTRNGHLYDSEGLGLFRTS